MGVSTTDKDKGAKRIIQQLAFLKNSSTTIGLHDDTGSYRGGKNPPTVAQVGFWNQFGTKSAPPRPWLSSAIDTNRSKIKAKEEKTLNEMIKGRISARKVVDKIGFFIKGKIKNRITRSMEWAIPNAASTVAQKLKGGALRGPTPLVKSGLMQRSVKHKVKFK